MYTDWLNIYINFQINNKSDWENSKENLFSDKFTHDFLQILSFRRCSLVKVLIQQSIDDTFEALINRSPSIVAP